MHHKIVRRGVCAAALALAAPIAVHAQAPASRWEVEGYGGVSASHASATAATLPAAGPSLDTLSPIFPTRAVPSWFFGDGATLFNGVQNDFSLGIPIVPLDPVLAAAAPGHGAAFGGRVRRALSARFALEGSVDVMPVSNDARVQLVGTAGASVASFKAGFSQLLDTGPFTGVNVTSTLSTSSSHARRDVALTAAGVWTLRTSGAWRPYVTLGGGVMPGGGEVATVTLDGRYQFAIVGAVPIDERDHVVVHDATRTVAIGVAGGGLRHDLHGGWAIRADARALFGPDNARVTLDAAPSVQTATPAGFTQTFTSPSIQFSNNASTGRTSSLSGAALQGFVTGSNGFTVRVLATIALVRRF